jgi:DNA-binding MarR family transcriptional regulator
MSHLILKNLPRYECLLEVAKQFPELNPKACETYMHLMRAGDEVFRVADTYFTKVNLSAGRFSVLVLLVDHMSGQPLRRSPAELADLLHCTRATMTGLIDTLEKDGMVRREANLEDRRTMHVVMTEQGLSYLHGILPEHFRRISSLMASLTEEECNTLIRLVDKVTEQASRLEPLAKDNSLSQANQVFPTCNP